MLEHSDGQPRNEDLSHVFDHFSSASAVSRLHALEITLGVDAHRELPDENAIFAGSLTRLMNGDEASRKVAAVCESCGTAYAAVKHQNGDIRPIGSPAGCCSGSELTVVDDESPDSDTSESW